jgi:hypothetical protein
VAIAAGLLVFSAIFVALSGFDEPGNSRDHIPARGMIVFGLTLIGFAALPFLQALLPSLPWDWLRSYRSGAGPVDSVQATVFLGGLALLGLRAIQLGIRARRTQRTDHDTSAE